jgi:predicted NAD/FAD-binding protein
MRIAVVGSGISGLVAANLLAGAHEVTVLEANGYLGGHTNTIEVAVAGRTHAVDTGFMVFNRRTYPHFCRLLELLGIDSQPSDMSYSVRCERTGLEYEGSSLNGLFAQRSNLVRPWFYRLLADMVRFNRDARRWLAHAPAEAISLGEFLARYRYSRQMVEQYLVPMGAAIWSARPESLLDFPARFILAFYENHGLLQIANRPQWRTIPGGAQRYVQRLAFPVQRVRLGSPVAKIRRHEDHVVVQLAGGEIELFDQVVLATHSDQSLRLLADADETERELLSAFDYRRNAVVVHMDTGVLPRSRRAWASWNSFVPASSTGAVSVTYDLSRLQRVAAARPILATLNDPGSIDPALVLRRIEYHHPVFGPRSLAAQARWSEISGRRRTHFCGAYWGYGFHEDGVNSGLAVARWFGRQLEQCTVASTKEPSNTAAFVP